MRKTAFSRFGGLVMFLPFLMACSSGGSSPATTDSGGNVGLTPDATLLAPADASSVYRDVLVDCVVAETSIRSCTFQTLPLIGHETDSPSIDAILARTVISHAWMGVRFREVLELMPDDILKLMKGVTAIVIADDVRPSNYSRGTGAIYLDPAHLWLTNEEKMTISRGADFRSNFGDALPFVSLSRYIEGNDYAWPYFGLTGTETRTLADIDRAFAALLFHELAHANDTFPPADVPFLDRTLSVWTAADAFRNQRISERLTDSLPLNSQLMFELAGVMYIGDTATAAHLALTAGQVGIEFENDGANFDYAYTDPAEDLAMLLEEVMMQRHYGVELQVAYTDAPINDGRFCSDYYVRWGFSNRTGKPLVKSRAEFGLQLLLDQPDVSAYLDTLPAPVRMTNDVTWCHIESTLATPKSLSASDANTLKTGDRASSLLRPDDVRSRH